MPRGHQAIQRQEGDNVVVLRDLTLHNPALQVKLDHTPATISRGFWLCTSWVCKTKLVFNVERGRVTAGESLSGATHTSPSRSWKEQWVQGSVPRQRAGQGANLGLTVPAAAQPDEQLHPEHPAQDLVPTGPSQVSAAQGLAGLGGKEKTKGFLKILHSPQPTALFYVWLRKVKKHVCSTSGAVQSCLSAAMWYFSVIFFSSACKTS